MNIQIAQAILIGFLLFFFVYVIRLRSVLTDRIIFIFGALLGIFLILRPDITITIANLIGIGRGTDLLLYVFIIISMFFYVSILAEFRRIDQKLTKIVRNIAITSPILGGENPIDPPKDR